MNNISSACLSAICGISSDACPTALRRCSDDSPTKDGVVVTSPQVGEQYVVHVRVYGKRGFCPPGRKVRLYWSYEGGDMSWNYAWGGAPYYPGDFCYPHGGYIGEASLSWMFENFSQEVTFNWIVPNKAYYCYATSPWEWQISLLAKVSDKFPTEGDSLSHYNINAFVKNNNNVARRNYTFYMQMANSLRNSDALSLSPNPTKNRVEIRYVLPDNAREAQVVVSSIYGQIVYSSVLDCALTSHIIDLAGMSSGSYSVKLICDGDLLVEETLVKQ